MNNIPNQERMFLAENIRRLRKLKKWSQEKLALEANTTNHCIIGLEAGTRNATIDTLSRIAHALGVNIHDITKPTR